MVSSVDGLHLVVTCRCNGDHSPDYRICVGASEIGAAWRSQRTGDRPSKYLRVRLDDPSLHEALTAAVIQAADGTSARLGSKPIKSCDLLSKGGYGFGFVVRSHGRPLLKGPFR